jgi:hypothetical protein
MNKKQQINMRLTGAEKSALKLKAQNDDRTLTQLLLNNITDGVDITRLVNTLEDINLKLSGVNGKLSKEGTLPQAQALANSILETIEKMDLPEPPAETVLSVIKRAKANQNK